MIKLPEDIQDEVKEFLHLYRIKPIKNNDGGMKSPHLFWTWYLLKTIKPKYVIESGVYKGLGTWVMRQACPDSCFFCIDPVPEYREYTDANAKYFKEDFNNIAWKDYLKPQETVCFFDDHQNAYERLQQMHWMNFKKCIFEDNYPVSQGDCYSMKKVYAECGFSVGGKQIINPNSAHRKWVDKNIKEYFECPPLWKPSVTRWGDIWDDKNYPTLSGLLTEVSSDELQIFVDEAKFYTWICYVELA